MDTVQTKRYIYVGKIWYPCVCGVTVIVESCIHPLLTHITHMHITDNTYIPNTPRPQCLTVFNPALHRKDVIYPSFLFLHGHLSLGEVIFPCLHKVNIVKLRCNFLNSCEFNLYKIWQSVAQDIRICSPIYHSNLLKNIF